MSDGITPRQATKAANALNNEGFLHHMVRAFAVHELGREWYELNASTPEIDILEFTRLTVHQITQAHALPGHAVSAVFRTSANEAPLPHERVTVEDFAAFAVFALFNGAAMNPKIKWGEIWAEVFNNRT